MIMDLLLSSARYLFSQATQFGSFCNAHQFYDRLQCEFLLLALPKTSVSIAKFSRVKPCLWLFSLPFPMRSRFHATAQWTLTTCYLLRGAVCWSKVVACLVDHIHAFPLGICDYLEVQLANDHLPSPVKYTSMLFCVQQLQNISREYYCSKMIDGIKTLKSLLRV